jgi:peptidoglycan/LPS O-acetylase OafA/YrhL
VSLFIRQLTGIRFVAAAWVLAYHLQGPLQPLGVLEVPVLSETLRVGRLGVDLFFALSGFILTHTYLERMGPSLRANKTAQFWWLRLARVYPVHLVMLIVAGVAVVAEARLAGRDAERDWLNPIDFLRNLLLIQEWGSDPQRGWNFVAWSLSMEWLAYLAFPLLVLVIWRMHRRLATGWLITAWFVALGPLMVYAMRTTDPYYTDAWGSTLRIATEFTAGAITYLIVQRIVTGTGTPTSSSQRLADVLGFVLPIAVIAGATLLGLLPVAQPPSNALNPDAEPLPPYFHLVLVPLLIAWIGALAVARRGMARWLATPVLVLGGFISYSLYMTHLVWFGLWRAGLRATGIESGPLYLLAVLLLVAGALLIAWLMWRIVEEPAREWMRRIGGARPVPTEEAGERVAESEGLGDSAEPIQISEAGPRPGPGAASGG